MSETTAIVAECLHSLGIDGVCRHCGRSILQEAAESTGAKLDNATALELDALAVIVSGFEKLPEEARSRVYVYLMSRFPQQRITR